ncbi:MAG: ribosome biogenesis GTPase Der [Candidatus Gracilibacteria bacterium]|jgi:GTP-binding protein
MQNTPTIAIVGRPNVGKSSLFNRLLNKRKAITASEAGTTRDRIMSKFEIEGYETILVDTGGLESSKQDRDLEDNVQEQARIAITDASIILFLVDVTQDLTADDYAAADILRKSSKPVIFIANKVDHPGMIDNTISQIYKLGFGDPIQISSIHNRGLDELTEALTKTLKKLKAKKSRVRVKAAEDKVKICILGRPNAGKSSLVNAVLGQEKLIVSVIPGTTRDAIDADFEYEEQKYVMIDTAGLRRSGKIEPGIEKYSALRAISAIEKSDICVLLLDGTDRISHQDCAIAQRILEEKKGVIIAVNKTDLFEKADEKENYIISVLKSKFDFIPYAPVVFISAKNKKNIFKILELAKEIMKERKLRIPTAELNTYFQEVCYKHMPSSTKTKKPKFMYVNQVDINPPKFLFFFKSAENLHFSYERYLENKLRERYGFTGTPVEMKFKSGV